MSELGHVQQAVQDDKERSVHDQNPASTIHIFAQWRLSSTWKLEILAAHINADAKHFQLHICKL